MMNPEAIIEAAKQGNVPATWRVLRPKSSYPATTGFLGGCFTFVFLVFLGIVAFFIGAVIGTAKFASNCTGSFSSCNPFGLVTSSLATATVVIGGGLVVVVIVGLLSAMRAVSRIPYSYFVFTPEGAVQATGPQKLTAIEYAAIDLINTRISVNTTTYRNSQTGAVTGRSSSVSVWGELHYRNGRTVRFKPASRFGSAESIIQRLINDHQMYRTLIGMRSPYGA